MAKGDDAVRKKKNKVLRKRLNADPSTMSTRIAGIIAAKQRRKQGKRRQCEGMCFTLPSPGDPFNEGIKKKEPKAKKKKKPKAKKLASDMNSEKVENRQKVKASPKTVVECLNAIQEAFVKDGTISSNKAKPVMVNTWGMKFWKSCSEGSDVLETSGASSTVEQIAWIASTAAAMFTNKVKGDANPFLLFIVPSKEKAIKVRSVCKHLKGLGVQTVSIHSGTSLDHQIEGLRSCEPDFLVSTPERLLELIALKAVDISAISLLVVDGLENFAKDGSFEKIKSIREAITGVPQTVIFNNSSDRITSSTQRKLLRKQFCTLSLFDSVTSENA
ncbi:hypothetical protein MKX01_004019 [Papaver californicum]|nr:hypothetical protein MKX01_004019 [Papaver californicum]